MTSWLQYEQLWAISILLLQVRELHCEEMAFSQSNVKKSKNAAFLTPNETHIYWKDRVHTELLIKTRFNRAVAAEFRGSKTPNASTRRSYDRARIQHGRLWKAREDIFLKALPEMLVRSGSNPKRDCRVDLAPDELEVYYHQTFRMPRNFNGTQIPRPPSENRPTYLKLFGQPNLWKPNQLAADAVFAELTMTRRKSVTPTRVREA